MRLKRQGIKNALWVRLGGGKVLLPISRIQFLQMMRNKQRNLGLLIGWIKCPLDSGSCRPFPLLYFLRVVRWRWHISRSHWLSRSPNPKLVNTRSYSR